MSTDTTDTTDEAPTDEEPQELSFEEGRAQTSRYSDMTKEYVAELPDGGVWRFEFQMLDNEEQLLEKNTTMTKGRQGVEEDTDIQGFRFDAFCAGIVDAPDGFPVSKTKLQQQDALTKKIVKEVADEIIDFTSADPETVHQFH